MSTPATISLPRHVAIVMDGNGRWATQRNNERNAGHRSGVDSVRAITRTCRRIGVANLTLFAFSEQNWERPDSEVAGLIDLLSRSLVDERREFVDNNIRLHAIGRLHKLPKVTQERLKSLIDETADNDAMTVTLALSFGGKEEIVDAARQLAERVERGELRSERVTAEMFESALSSAPLGPVDLLIRTGGEMRISNFLLWSCAYAELYFTDELWPDFNEDSLLRAFAEFAKRDRRFGLVSDRMISSTRASG